MKMFAYIPKEQDFAGGPDARQISLMHQNVLLAGVTMGQHRGAENESSPRHLLCDMIRSQLNCADSSPNSQTHT